MQHHRESPPKARDVTERYIRPLTARNVRGMAWAGEDLLVLDMPSGRLMRVDPATDGTAVLNDGHTEAFEGARGLAHDNGRVWFTTDSGVHTARISGQSTTGVETLIPAEGFTSVAVWDGCLYLVRGEVLEVRTIDSPDTVVAQVPLHGIGAKSMSATHEALWISDDLEQTVYRLDRETLETTFRVVTPLEQPSAIAVRREPGKPEDTVHVAYYEWEPFLRLNPFIDPCWEVRYRHRTLVHQLRFLHDPGARRAWSTGHRMVMHYYVEIEPDSDTPELQDVQWRMSLPIDTLRQRLIDVEPIGLPFELVTEQGQPVAVFRIPRIGTDTRMVIGWRATLEVFGIKHLVSFPDMDGAPELSAEMAAEYLIDDEDLDLDSPEIAAATAEAVGDARNPLEKAHRIRTYVYDRLEYEMGNADSPIRVLERGTGSCGEHVGTMMALMRKAGLATRVAGRYKCPYYPWNGGPLHPDFNHVWVDLFLPGYGWVPVESNPDGDIVKVGPYPDRFFMGLPWRHVEVGKDISFEKVTYDAGTRRRRIGARRLSANDIRFDVLTEIAPV